MSDGREGHRSEPLGNGAILNRLNREGGDIRRESDSDDLSILIKHRTSAQ